MSDTSILLNRKTRIQLKILAGNLIMTRIAAGATDPETADKSKKQSLLTSTSRRDIVRLLSERGPSSVADLATDMGRPADALYYHIRILLQNSLITKSDIRRSRRRDMTIYSVVGNIGSKKKGKNWSKSPQETASLLNTADREYKRGIGLPSAVTRGEGINVLVDRHVAWFTDEELKSFKKHLSALEEKMKRGAKRENSRLFAFTYTLNPLEMKPIRRPNS